jgi:hypothetical protein
MGFEYGHDMVDSIIDGDGQLRVTKPKDDQPRKKKGELWTDEDYAKERKFSFDVTIRSKKLFCSFNGCHWSVSPTHFCLCRNSSSSLAPASQMTHRFRHGHHCLRPAKNDKEEERREQRRKENDEKDEYVQKIGWDHAVV